VTSLVVRWVNLHRKSLAAKDLKILRIFFWAVVRLHKGDTLRIGIARGPFTVLTRLRPGIHAGQYCPRRRDILWQSARGCFFLLHFQSDPNSGGP